MIASSTTTLSLEDRLNVNLLKYVPTRATEKERKVLFDAFFLQTSKCFPKARSPIAMLKKKKKKGKEKKRGGKESDRVLQPRVSKATGRN